MLSKHSLLLAPQKAILKNYRVDLFSNNGITPNQFKFQTDQFNQSSMAIQERSRPP